MKKIFYIFAIVVLCMALVLPVGATEETVLDVTEAITAEATENADEAVTEDMAESVNLGEISEIIKEAPTMTDAIIAVADKLGVTVDEAEALVAEIVALGDKYLGETELWEMVRNDIYEHPEKYVIVALVFLIFIALVAFMLRWIIQNIGQMRTMKLNIASLKKSVDGDDSDEGRAESLRGLITARNNEIKALEQRDKEFEAEIIKLREQAAEVTRAADEVKKNTENALNVTQESALQIAQLLCIAMDKGKMPVVTKEARRIWYENAQSKIKAAAGVEESDENDGETDEIETKVQDT